MEFQTADTRGACPDCGLIRGGEGSHGRHSCTPEVIALRAQLLEAEPTANTLEVHRENLALRAEVQRLQADLESAEAEVRYWIDAQTDEKRSHDEARTWAKRWKAAAKVLKRQRDDIDKAHKIEVKTCGMVMREHAELTRLVHAYFDAEIAMVNDREGRDELLSEHLRTRDALRAAVSPGEGRDNGG